MNIGVDAHILGKGKGGAERYVAELCHRLPRLAPEDSFYFFINKAYKPLDQPANVCWIRLTISDPLIQRSLILPLLISKFKLDLIHTQRIAPLWSRCPVIVSIHDILPLTEPNDYVGLRHMLIRALTGWTSKRARSLLTVSNTVKQEMEENLPSAKGKIKAVYNGVDHAFFSQGKVENRPIEDEYLLYTGAIEPRKNLEILIEAYSEVCSQITRKLTLILAGMTRDQAYAAKLSSLAEKCHQNGRIIFTGFLTEEQYLQYLQSASIFLAPSRGEGFDLPPLEAMACQVPVICSDIPVHRELFNSAALFFLTDSAPDLAKKILTLYKDKELHAKLQRQGTSCAARFSWEQTACQVSRIYRENGAARPAL
jgi:glycosyltransferase involved in cell wall biosynthesis